MHACTDASMHCVALWCNQWSQLLPGISVGCVRRMAILSPKRWRSIFEGISGPGETVADSLVKTGVQQHEMQSDLIPSHWTTSVPLFRVHRTPFCFASFGVQEIIEKIIENEAQSSSKPLPGASGGTLGPHWGPKREKGRKIEPTSTKGSLPF